MMIDFGRIEKIVKKDKELAKNMLTYHEKIDFILGVSRRYGDLLEYYYEIEFNSCGDQLYDMFLYEIKTCYKFASKGVSMSTYKIDYFIEICNNFLNTKRLVIENLQDIDESKICRLKKKFGVDITISFRHDNIDFIYEL